MSEPVQTEKLDLNALGQALDESGASNDTAPAPPEAAEEIKPEHSNTLAQAPADAAGKDQPAKATAQGSGAESPATLSPSSPRDISPSQPAASAEAPAPFVHPLVEEMKAMFPDFDLETIAAVASSRGGDKEAVVNALLQMSDPTYKPPTPEAQTDIDALLAQSLAMEEERQRIARPAPSGGRGGGGAASFFGNFMGGSSEQHSTSTPSYDPNALTYQPRVRRPPPSPGARAAYAAPHDPNQATIPGMPGTAEAKQWQEEINKMAENGFAKAAMTFSSLKQKASAAFNAPQGGESVPAQSPAAQGGNTAQGSFWKSGRGGGGAANYLQGISSAFGPPRQGSAPAPKSGSVDQSRSDGFFSPRSPQMGEYDRDPSPVGDNELAKILARGSRNKNLADRHGSSGSSVAAGKRATTSSQEEYEGWESAGKKPIQISDNTKDSVAMMDSAQGRGVTSPRARSPTRESAQATGAGVGATAMAASSQASKDDGSDSDDLEYVSNSFEDED